MRARSSVAAAIAAVVLVSPVASAQQAFTMDHLKQLVGVSSPDVSPDGKSIAFVVSKPNYTTDRTESELYLVEAAGGTPRALTFGRKRVGSPKWSPDGKWLAFESPDSAGLTQLWLLPMGGGEARQLTSHVTGVDQFSRSPLSASV